MINHAATAREDQDQIQIDPARRRLQHIFGITRDRADEWHRHRVLRKMADSWAVLHSE